MDIPVLQVWRSENDFQESVFAFCHIGPRFRTQAYRQVPFPAEPSCCPFLIIMNETFCCLETGSHEAQAGLELTV